MKSESYDQSKLSQLPIHNYDDQTENSVLSIKPKRKRIGVPLNNEEIELRELRRKQMNRVSAANSRIRKEKQNEEEKIVNLELKRAKKNVQYDIMSLNEVLVKLAKFETNLMESENHNENLENSINEKLILAGPAVPCSYIIMKITETFIYNP